jgi:flagellar FliJ protein
VKRFGFSLEKVLRLRKHREQEAEMELGRAMGTLVGIENNIKETARQRHGAASERFSRDHNAAEIKSYDNYIARLDRETGRLLEEAAKAGLLVEKKRQAYLEASRERKVLDKLREKREKEYGKEMLNEETKNLDDISGGNAARELIKGMT